MPSLLALLDTYVFAGVIGNVSHDLLKAAKQRIAHKSRETFYVDLFEQAIKADSRWLTERAAPDGSVALDRDALIRALHQDVRVHLRTANYADLRSETFVEDLARALADRSAIVIGGHTLSEDDYLQISRNLVRIVAVFLRSATIQDEELYRQATLDMQEDTHSQVVGLREENRVGLAALEAQLEALPQVLKQMENEGVAARLATVTTERDHLREALTSERDRRWNERFEHLRTQLDAGYGSAVQTQILDLADEVLARTEEDSDQINQDLQGRIYRLAASALLPYRAGGDAARCRDYLNRARHFSLDTGLVKCQMIQAILMNAEHGLASALSLLEQFDDDEVVRLRFGLYLEHGALDECQHMIGAGQVDRGRGESDLEWARLLALYYAAVNKREECEACVTILTRPQASGDHLEVAGLALARLSFDRLQRFCFEHSVSPEFRFMLDLDDLVDAETRDRAVACFTTASERYQSHGCHTDAIRTLVAAVRLRLDQGETEALTTLLEQLRHLDPVHVFLTAAKQTKDDETATGVLDALEEALRDPLADSMFVLHRASHINTSAAVARRAADLLIANAPRFSTTPVAQVQFEVAVLQLLQSANADTEAEAWLVRVSAPNGLGHVRLLCHVAFYAKKDQQVAAEWLAQAEALAPDRPEVLATSIVFATQTGAIDTRIEAAEQLYAILRTRQTIAWLLAALQDGRRWPRILEMLDALADREITEEQRRFHRAAAYLGLGQALEARVDLEWLYQQRLATPSTLVALARIYMRLYRIPEAVALLRECVEHYHDTEAYFYLSYALLVRGRRDESFSIVRQARYQHPHDPQVAFHLLDLGFTTGYEASSEVRRALQELLPGGSFADYQSLQPLDLDAIRSLLVAGLEADQQAERLYRSGRISALIRCLAVSQPLAWFHARVRQNAAQQLVPPVLLGPDTSWWRLSKLPGIVADYSALLAGYAIFSENLFALLRSAVDTLWIPARLLDVLEWEHIRLLNHGQVGRYRSQLAVRDAIISHMQRFRFHPVTPGSSAITDPRIAAAGLGRRMNIPYIEAYPDSKELGDPTSVDLSALAIALQRLGLLGPTIVQALREQTSSETWLAGSTAPARGSEIVTTVETLVAFAAAGALDGLLRYVGTIHLVDTDWQRLRAAIEEFATIEATIGNLDRLRILIRDGMEDGFIRVAALLPEDRLFYTHLYNNEDDEASQESLLNLATAYTDELLSLAHRQNAPLWTDDRATWRTEAVHQQPVDRFGTDTLIEWLRSRGDLAHDAAFDMYGGLVHWGYIGLAIVPDYLRWMLRQGLTDDADVLTVTLDRYRESLLDLWAEGGPYGSPTAPFVRTYIEQSAEVLLACFVDSVPATLAGVVFQRLDASRVQPGLIGREPTYLGALLALLPTSPEFDREIFNRRRDLGDWLDAVLIESGVGPEAIGAAWLYAFDQAIKLYDNWDIWVNEQERYVYLRMLLAMTPERSYLAIAPTQVGASLRRMLGQELQPHTVIVLTSPNGTPADERYEFPTRLWERDLDRAVDRYLASPTSQPIAVGLVTVQALPSRPGSPFVCLRYVPTSARPPVPIENIAVPIRVVSLFRRFAHQNRAIRRTAWAVGNARLQTSGLPTHAWEALKRDLLAGDSRQWRPASHRALRMLFSHWTVVREYVVDAASLGSAAMEDLLSQIAPQDVAAWHRISLSALRDETSLQEWAQRISFPSTSEENVETVLAALTAHVGHSMFPDVSVLRERILALVMGLDSVGVQRQAISSIIQRAQQSVSRAVKANAALIALEWLNYSGILLDSSSDLECGIRNLIEQVMQPLADAEVTALLTPMIGRTLYAHWRRAKQIQLSSECLSYLAFVGAGYLADILAAHASHDAMEALVDSLWNDMADEERRRGIEPQPEGLFRPGWATVLNYSAALFLQAGDRIRYTFAADDEGVREAMLRSGMQHRILHTILDTRVLERTWLDSGLAADVGIGVAVLIGEPPDSPPDGWTERQRLDWVVCAHPEAGPLMLQLFLDHPLSDDPASLAGVIRAISFGRTTVSQGWTEYLHALLALESLQQVRQFPGAYREFLWMAREVLNNTKRYDSTLREVVRQSLAEIPPDTPQVKAVIEFTADVLAQWMVAGGPFDEVVVWLQRVATHDVLPLEARRAALRPFIRYWPTLPRSAQQRLAGAVQQIAALAERGSFWEIQWLLDRWKEAQD